MSYPTTKKTRATLALLLAGAMAATLLAAAPIAAQADPVTHTKVLTPLEPGNTLITDVGVNRGRHMIRESLGVSVDAGAVLEARVTNNVDDIVMTLTTDDHQQDVQQTLPVDGSWLTITAKKASVVFARSREWATAPTIEYRVVSGTEYVTPEYRLGESQSAFVDGWAAGTAPFALIVDETFTMLVPRLDLPKVQDMGWSQFNSLDDVINSYRLLIGTYDQWLGIDDDHPNPVHHNLPQAYMIRPDINGPGLAYYGPHNAVGTNNASVSYYLEGPSAWLILHEIGHGYDGMMTGGNGPADMHLGEVWNNVYAYLYQSSITGEQNNWLYNNGRVVDQKNFDQNRRNAGGQDFNVIDVRLRLDVLARIAELTGTEGFAQFNRGLREYRAADGFTQWPSRVDLIADLWGRDAGYDVLPWLEQFGLKASPTVNSLIRDLEPLPSVLPLGDYFSDYAVATAAAAELGLLSPGQLVATPDLQDLNYSGSIKATATIADNSRVEGASATLWTGTELVGAAAFRNGVADFGKLPIGSYTLRLPQDSAMGAVPASQSVKVSHNAATDVPVTYADEAVAGNVNGSTLSLRGLGDGNFAEITHDPAAGTITVVDGRGAPHSYFPGEEYARVTISEGANNLFDRSFIGDTGRQNLAATTTVPAVNGTVIEVKHREHSTRVIELDPTTGAAKPSLNATAQITQYVVTAYGLEKVASPGSAETDFVAALDGALNRVKTTSLAHPGARLESQAASLSQAISLVNDATQRAAFVAAHQETLDGLVRRATVSLAPVTLANTLASQAGQPSSNLFDGNLTSAFHSPWSETVTFPYNIDLSLGSEPVELSSLVLVPHDPGGTGASNGRPGEYRILAGDDANNLTEIASGTWANTNTSKLVRLQGAAKFLRLQITSTYGSSPMTFVAAREIQVFGGDTGALSLKMSRTDAVATPQVGDVLKFDVTYTNNEASALTAFPRSSNLARSLTTGTPNCRYVGLGAGVTRTCVTAEHKVTETDIRRGQFTPVVVFDATADNQGNTVLDAGFVATTGPVLLG